MTQPDLKRVPHHFIFEGSQRLPKSSRTIFADGSADSTFRPGIDLELSHWVPTTTPVRWAADTSTEICMRFMEDPAADQYDLAVNNHLDVDGILSLFVLLFPEMALANRAIVVAAAEHGDLQAAVAQPGVLLAEEHTSLVVRSFAACETMQDRYAAGFDLTCRLLSGARKPAASATAAWEIIELGQRMLADGTVKVTPVTERLVSFVLPPLTGDERARALSIPAFSTNVDNSVFLWPHARNREYGQQVHLVSLPTSSGWFHDLWLPGYVWANTPDRWTVPGLEATGGSNEWTLCNQGLSSVIESLRAQETNEGRWMQAEKLTPFSSIAGRGFPVVASFVNSLGEPAVSALNPELVSSALAGAF
jgi:hypothetical protein